jgi:hypothetical protein
MTRLEFTVPGRPCSKNNAFAQRKGHGVRLSDAARDFIGRVHFAAIGAIGHERCPFSRNVAIVVTSHFPRDADSGASIALVKDALQGIVYRNDRCVVFEASWKGNPRPDDPFTSIAVWELDAADCRVRIPVPVDCALDTSARTKASRATALEVRKASAAFDTRRGLRSSRRDYRTPEADPWADIGSTTKIPVGF